jgi:hypothetical protein
VNRLSGRTAATAGVAGNAACALWNPSATMRVEVYEIGLFATTAPAAGSGIAVQRISARGTQTLTTLAAIANDSKGTTAASSTATLDLTYSSQPTVVGTSVTNAMFRYPLAAVVGSGFVQPFPEGIIIPPGAGLAILAVAAVIVPVSDVYFVFDE